MYQKIYTTTMILAVLALGACSGHSDLKAPCSFPSSSFAEIDSIPCMPELINLAQF